MSDAGDGPVTYNFGDTRDVLIADKADIHVKVPERRPLPMPLVRSLDLLDRQPEVETLLDHIDLVREEGRLRPLVVVLTGVAQDSLALFVERFGNHEFRARAGETAEHIGQVTWPTLSFRRFVEQLTNRLTPGDPVVVPRAEEVTHLAALIAARQAPLFVSSVLNDVDASQRHPAVLQEWAEFFGTTCGTPRHLAIMVLVVELRDPRSTKCRRLTQQVAALSERYQFHSFEASKDVPSSYPLNWIRLYNKTPLLPDALPHIPESLVDRVYAGRKSLRFGAVYEGMLQAIGELYEPSGLLRRFVER